MHEGLHVLVQTRERSPCVCICPYVCVHMCPYVRVYLSVPVCVCVSVQRCRERVRQRDVFVPPAPLKIPGARQRTRRRWPLQLLCAYV